MRERDAHAQTHQDSLSWLDDPLTPTQFPRPRAQAPGYLPCYHLHYWPLSCFLLPAPSQGFLTCDPVLVLGASTPSQPLPVSTTFLKVEVEAGEGTLAHHGVAHHPLSSTSASQDHLTCLCFFVYTLYLNASISLQTQALLPVCHCCPINTHGHLCLSPASALKLLTAPTCPPA